MKESQFKYILNKSGDPNLPEEERWKNIKYISTLTSASPVFDFQKYVRGYEANLLNNNTDECSVEYITSPIPGFKVIDYQGLNPTASTKRQKTTTFIPLKFILSVSVLPPVKKTTSLKLIFNVNGGNNGPGIITGIEENTVIDLSQYKVPTHSDDVDGTKIVFLGWSTIKSDKIYFIDDEMPEIVTTLSINNSSVNLYAIWAYDIDQDGIPDITEDYDDVYTGSSLVDFAIVDDAKLYGTDTIITSNTLNNIQDNIIMNEKSIININKNLELTNKKITNNTKDLSEIDSSLNELLIKISKK